MSDKNKTTPASLRDPVNREIGQGNLSARFELFERRQKELWRLTFLLLFILALFFALVSWDALRSFSHRLEALPIGLVVLVVLFGFYVLREIRENHEIRALVRRIEEIHAMSPGEKKPDQLFDLISRSQQGYRDLIDSFDDHLLALNLQGEILAANRSFADLVEEPFSQVIGRPLLDFLDDPEGEGRRAVEHALPRFLERRQWTGVVRAQVKGRQKVQYFDCLAQAMTRADSVQGITVLARDITALRENEARFTEIFETLQEGIYITTPESRVVDVNPALVRMLGYDSKEEVLAKQVVDFFAAPEELKRIQQEVDSQPKPAGHEITLLRKDGSPLVCLNTAAAVRDTSGRVVRYQGALMDITERREMERRLHKEQEFARRLVDSLPDLIMVLDVNASYTFISPRIKEVLGFEVEESMGLSLGDRTHPEDRPVLRALFDDLVAGKQVFASLEVRVRHKHGDWRRVRCHFSPLFNEAGKIEGVVISARDVTELKRLEEQLIQSEKLAAMGQMLAGVAHELNNPLTAVLGVTELLRERADMGDSARRQLDLTHRQARRAARIVQNLLDFSRPAAPQKKLLDVNALIERTLQLHEHSLRRSNIAVDFHPQPALPSVMGDANQLIQVFLNLITNAEHAIREVRDSGRIQIRLQHAANRVGITVQDDGVGIRPEALPKLFDPFYTTKRPGGGTGLGLSICLAIVGEHHGTIDAESLPAGGSAFTVYLPAAAQPQASPSPVDSAIHSASALRQMADILKGRSVLVVDDEESIRMLLQEGLSAQGIRVDCAAGLDEALACASRAVYDAVLCDLDLKNGSANGQETVERILAAISYKPVILFMTGDFVESPGTSADGRVWRLQKPFRISQVLALLAEALYTARETLAH